MPTLLKFRQATVFAPNNAAMRSFAGQKDQDLLLYHLGMRLSLIHTGEHKSTVLREETSPVVIKKSEGKALVDFV